MFQKYVLTVIASVFPAFVVADTIVVDGRLYEDVLITESPTRYLVRIPAEGKVIGVYKSEVRTEDVHISNDETLRKALRDLWMRNRGVGERNLPSSAQDIHQLLASGVIAVETRGSTIEYVEVLVKNLTDGELDMVIPAGTYFVAGSGVQNMVARERVYVSVKPQGTVRSKVPAACANRTRKIPGNGDKFNVREHPADPELALIADVLMGLPYPVAQATVWILTDNASFADLGILTSSFGGRAIQESDVRDAVEVLEQAGINVKRKRIWDDRYLWER